MTRVRWGVLGVAKIATEKVIPAMQRAERCDVVGIASREQSKADAAAARQWTRYNVEARRVRRYLPETAWLSLRYEDLCADPGAVFDRISDFVGVPRAAIRIGQRSEASHIVGNKMRLQAVSEIREDRSWESRLDAGALATLARIAGPTSRQLGYDWP